MTRFEGPRQISRCNQLKGIGKIENEENEVSNTFSGNPEPHFAAGGVVSFSIVPVRN